MMRNRQLQSLAEFYRKPEIAKILKAKEDLESNTQRNHPDFHPSTALDVSYVLVNDEPIFSIHPSVTETDLRLDQRNWGESPFSQDFKRIAGHFVTYLQLRQKKNESWSDHLSLTALYMVESLVWFSQQPSDKTLASLFESFTRSWSYYSDFGYDWDFHSLIYQSMYKSASSIQQLREKLKQEGQTQFAKNKASTLLQQHRSILEVILPNYLLNELGDVRVKTPPNFLNLEDSAWRDNKGTFLQALLHLYAKRNFSRSGLEEKTTSPNKLTHSLSIYPLAPNLDVLLNLQNILTLKPKKKGIKSILPLDDLVCAYTSSNDVYREFTLKSGLLKYYNDDVLAAVFQLISAASLLADAAKMLEEIEAHVSRFGRFSLEGLEKELSRFDNLHCSFVYTLKHSIETLHELTYKLRPFRINNTRMKLDRDATSLKYLLEQKLKESTDFFEDGHYHHSTDLDTSLQQTISKADQLYSELTDIDNSINNLSSAENSMSARREVASHSISATKLMSEIESSMRTTLGYSDTESTIKGVTENWQSIDEETADLANRLRQFCEWYEDEPAPLRNVSPETRRFIESANQFTAINDLLKNEEKEKRLENQQKLQTLFQAYRTIAAKEKQVKEALQALPADSRLETFNANENALIDKVFDNLLILTNRYLYSPHHYDKYSRFAALGKCLDNPQEPSKFRRLGAYLHLLEQTDKKLMGEHAWNSWLSYIYEALSILTVLPALARACSSYSNYGTFRFWQPESQKAYGAISRAASELGEDLDLKVRFVAR